MANPLIASPLEPAWAGLGATVGVTGQGWRVAESFAGDSVELGAARAAVALGDDTPRGKILMQGDGVASVAQAIEGHAGSVGTVVTAGMVEIVCLRPDIVQVGTSPEALAPTFTTLVDAAAEAAVTCTDITHGRYELRLIGPRAAELLSKVCGLDFHDSAFADKRAQETSVAKTKQLVVRSDIGNVPAYRLLGGRALGAYMWDTLMEAGAGLGIEPIGATALNTLAG